MLELGTILCPFCFKKVKIKDLWYCCNTCDVSKSLLAGVKPLHVNIHGKERRIITDGKVRGGFCTCGTCGNTTSDRVCPECESLLPGDILESPTSIISIVGARGSGKSYFVATLLKKLYEDGLLYHVAGISALWAIQDSLDEYNRRFASKMASCMRLAATDHGTNIVKDYPPLLLELQREKSKKRYRRTYTFFDAAGEKFKGKDILATITPYLGHSEAVILILDPLHLPELCMAITGHLPEAKDEDEDLSKKKYSYVLDNTAKVIRDALRLKTDKKIKSPLCVCISKWDLLVNTPGLLDPGLLVSKQNLQHTNGYDAAIVNSASDEIRSLLQGWEPNLIAYAEGNFETVKYFGFSAWGFKDVSDGKVPTIASYRVEDPFLWLLNREGIV